MKRIALIAVALLFASLVTMHSFAADGGEVSAITAAVKKYVASEAVESVYVEKVVGDYAAAIVAVKDGDGGIAYLKRGGEGWKVLNYGATMGEEALTGVGVPADVVKKLLE